jgi:hypothetical protein
MSDAVSQSYRHRATEVERLANIVISEGHRAELLDMSAKWLRLADERDEYLRRWNLN